MTTLSVTSEFRHEFEAERTAWLRRRFLWYSGIVGGLGVLDVVNAIGTVFVLRGRDVLVPNLMVLAVTLVSIAIFVVPFVYVKSRSRRLDRERLLRLVTGMIVAVGVVQLVEIPIAVSVARAVQARAETAQSEAPSDEAPAEGVASVGAAAAAEAEEDGGGLTINVGGGPSPANAALLRMPMGLVWVWSATVLMTHLIASVFIPWTPRESFRPVWPLVALGAVFIVVYSVIIRGAGWVPAGLTIAGLPVIGVPGAMIASWRHGRFRSKFSYRMLRGAYGDMKRELTDARKIHEALFPAAIASGPVRMSYRYEPMRQIGGDYLFARMVEVPGRSAPVFDAVLIDVTGHGISAALTVNRLHGEIQRELGEKPDLSPGELLKGLNAYLHHTLASHSVYATAVCVRIDPAASTLEWASAGHPPAFLCTADGRMERLDSTAFILGVTGAADYDADQQTTRFMPGDSIVLYTDGAIEARDRNGRQIRVEGLQRILAGMPRGSDRVGTILETVDRHRAGPVEDDTLIVEIARPV
jgi:hypothetical protein